MLRNDVNILFDFSIKLLVYLILVVFLCCLEANITKNSFVHLTVECKFYRLSGFAIECCLC